MLKLFKTYIAIAAGFLAFDGYGLLASRVAYPTPCERVRALKTGDVADCDGDLYPVAVAAGLLDAWNKLRRVEKRLELEQDLREVERREWDRILENTDKKTPDSFWTGVAIGGGMMAVIVSVVLLLDTP